MKIIEKLANKQKDMYGNSAITIAFLGDSVTQGCFECYTNLDGGIETYFNTEKAYQTKVVKIINMLYPNVAINIINAGISGGNAENGAARLERDVLKYSPDLCVVCFGLNDCNGDIEIYKKSMNDIFDRLLKNGTEVIFLTPNMMCDEVSCHILDNSLMEIAKGISEKQNEGILDKFLCVASEIARDKNIPVCDCYKKWKILKDGGVRITDLLSNYINHPIPDMHYVFAYSLIETMFIS